MRYAENIDRLTEEIKAYEHLIDMIRKALTEGQIVSRPYEALELIRED